MNRGDSMLKESIFEVLYCGGVSPWENSRLPLPKEYTAKIQKANEIQEQIVNMLNPDEKKLFDDFLSANSMVSSCF